MKRFSFPDVSHVSVVFLFAALACGGQNFTGQTNREGEGASALGSSRHGMWVTRMAEVLNGDPNATDLLDFARRNHLTELYLGMGQGVISDARLPGFVRQLKDADSRSKR